MDSPRSLAVKGRDEVSVDLIHQVERLLAEHFLDDAQRNMPAKSTRRGTVPGIVESPFGQTEPFGVALEPLR